MSQSEQALQEKKLATAPWSVSLVILALLGINATIIYGLINLLSWQFTFASINAQRPIVEVLMLFAAAFAGYLAAIVAAKRAKQDFRLISVIIGFAVLFRIVTVFSCPIQEVDIYRYMWDGEVQTQGVSPFKYSPLEVQTAVNEAEKRELNEAKNPSELSADEAIDADAKKLDPDLEKLVALCAADPSVKQVLRRVHIEYLPTIYPPTSQFVFRVVSMISPSGAWAMETDDPVLRQEKIEQAVNHRLWVMKTVLVGFDLGVLLLLIGLLSLCRMPIGLSVVYGWCPLVMKEVANGGHLDAIAVFLSVLALYLLVRLVTQPASDAAQSRRSSGGFMLSVLAALVLAAAVGAKLYPIVLAPLVFGGIVRRFNWLATIVATIAFTAATFLLVLPILPSWQSDVVTAAEQLTEAEQLPAAEQLAAAKLLPAVQRLAREKPSKQNFEDDPSAGLTTFINQWEMNDFIFMIVVENVKTDPEGEVPPNKLPIWFSVVPQGARRLIVDPVVKRHEIRLKETEQKFESAQQRLATAKQKVSVPAQGETVERELAEIKAGIYLKEAEYYWQQIADVKADIFQTPFKITRVLTSFVFLLLALWLAWRAGAKAGSSEGLASGRFYCEAAFLTLAWFWLMLPTQNPWYWLWALPFLPFMRNRAWLAVSGIILVYYFRFWLEYNLPTTKIWGTPYQGVAFFDFVLTWFEFAPWFVWLAIEGFVRVKWPRDQPMQGVGRSNEADAL